MPEIGGWKRPALATSSVSAAAVEWNVAEILLEQRGIGESSGVETCADQSGANGVDADLPRSKLVRRGSKKADQCGFAGIVCGEIRFPVEGVRGRGEEDGAAPPFLHSRRRWLHRVKCLPRFTAIVRFHSAAAVRAWPGLSRCQLAQVAVRIRFLTLLAIAALHAP